MAQQPAVMKPKQRKKVSINIERNLDKIDGIPPVVELGSISSDRDEEVKEKEPNRKKKTRADDKSEKLVLNKGGYKPIG